nr:clathrin heavy chain [Paramoeba perurans]
MYFGVLLEKGKLNKVETLELCRVVLGQGRLELVHKWLEAEKLECSEELGDMLRQYDMKTAMQVYYRGNVSHKVVVLFAETGQYEKILQYCHKTGFTPDWVALMQSLLNVQPGKAVDFAKNLVSGPNGPLVSIEALVDIFMSRNLLQETTSFLLDVLKDNKPEQGPLQTKLIELNLMGAPQVADAILNPSPPMFTHYNKPHVAQLCEKAGLFRRALEHMTELEEVKRVLAKYIQGKVEIEFLLPYFGNLSAEDGLDMLKSLLKMRGNVKFVSLTNGKQLAMSQLVAQIATEYSQPMTPAALINLFEIEGASDGMYYFLGQAVNFSEDPIIHNNYIMAATKVGDLGAVENTVSKSNFYEPAVIRNMCPVAELVVEVEQRNRLKLILDWLEARASEGNTEAALYNALAKIYIDDSSKDSSKFLVENQFYDSRAVGKYAESRDPHLAFIAYKRGKCDDELVEVTNANGLFKNQARYLVERQDEALWGKVLVLDNEHRPKLIAQIIQVALPESDNPDEVSAAVQAFMAADLQSDLIELLEKVILDTSKFSSNPTLQNLLIVTAVKADSTRVMNYIQKLTRYDGPEIASICVNAQLFEEAFVIFKKFNLHSEGIQVLVENVNDMERAYDFAESVKDPKVYSNLAAAQLNRGMVKEAIRSFIKAGNHEYFRKVIVSANEQGLHEELINYLDMCRQHLKHPDIESELMYAYAVTENLASLQEFISSPNVGQIQEVGDRFV